MLFQLCHYSLVGEPDHRPGLARMASGFDCYDVVWVVDAITGKVVRKSELNSYTLFTGPLAQIDSEYPHQRAL